LSGIIVLLKMPPKYRKLKCNRNKNMPQKIMYTLTTFVERGLIVKYTMMAKAMKALELHYIVQ